MLLSAAPAFEPQNTNFNMTCSDPAEYIYKIRKNRKSGKSSFILNYMHYSKWHPSGVQQSLDVGCGNLIYELVDKSWEGSDIMGRPIGDSYFSPKGTVHLINGDEKEQIGDHIAILEVSSDQVEVSSKQNITFNIEILDCKVEEFAIGEQEELKDITVTTGEVKRLKLIGFT